MPGEFTASPRHPVTSEPLSSYNTTATASASKGKSAAAQEPEQLSRSSSHTSQDPPSSQSPSASEPKPKSSMRAALSKAAHKLTPSKHSSKGSESLASSEEEFEKMKRAEGDAEKRRAEYKQYNLGSKGFGKGSMQMGG